MSGEDGYLVSIEVPGIGVDRPTVFNVIVSVELTFRATREGGITTEVCLDFEPCSWVCVARECTGQLGGAII